MLVKLGKVWVDPQKVTAIHAVYEQREIYIIVPERNLFNKYDKATVDELDNFCDEYAAIINNAAGQSYGGEDVEAGAA